MKEENERQPMMKVKSLNTRTGLRIIVMLLVLDDPPSHFSSAVLVLFSTNKELELRYCLTRDCGSEPVTTRRATFTNQLFL